MVEESDCCLEKTVGGVSYALVREEDTSGYNCLANCIYQKNDEGGMFCFAAGDLEVVCGDDGEFTDMPPVGNFATCPTGNPLPDINCGRGGSRCPSGYVCNIDPADSFAVCCSEGKPGNPTICPKERPEFNSPCNSSEDSARCEYGNQTCCGESFPEIIMECMEDTWAGLAVETPCFMQGHSCGPVTKPPPQNCICQEIYAPVCGTNGQTYSNTCFARCELQTAACIGECPCTSDCICLAVFSPVCGADGQTYSNSCQAGCVNAKVDCEGECPCSSDCICPAVFSPVCGIDGQTYSNACEAGCANTKAACEGECPCA